MRATSFGEADVTLDLFTKDWGRITAHARGLRRETSRLRYVLQPMSWVSLNIVRGLGGWRITTANPEHVSLSLRAGRSSLARVVRIVQKFFPHEVMSEQVFLGLLWHTSMLLRDSSRAKDWEALTLARMFRHLGYWGIDTHKDVLSQEVFGDEGLSDETRITLVREINRILRTVHT
jgi:recombinational DNA repair protein (RecF pathway)